MCKDLGVGLRSRLVVLLYAVVETTICWRFRGFLMYGLSSDVGEQVQNSCGKVTDGFVFVALAVSSLLLVSGYGSRVAKLSSSNVVIRVLPFNSGGLAKQHSSQARQPLPRSFANPDLP